MLYSTHLCIIALLALPIAMTVRAAGPSAKLTISSDAFADGALIPKEYTADGKDISPALTWQGVPDNAKELLLICDDPDAPRAEPWVHWILYKIPGSAAGLPREVRADAKLKEPVGALQGLNSWNTTGYRGPSPPPGKLHHYHFHLYALDTALDSRSGLDKEALLEAMAGHIIAEGDLVGTYQR